MLFWPRRGGLAEKAGPSSEGDREARNEIEGGEAYLIMGAAAAIAFNGTADKYLRDARVFCDCKCALDMTRKEKKF